MPDQLPRLGGLSEPEKYERLVERVPGVWWSDAGPFAGLHELNALQVVWAEEYVQHTMPEAFHDFARFITPAELTEELARYDMVVQEMKGVERAGDGTGRRVLTGDLSVTYLGWALRTR